MKRRHTTDPETTGSEVLEAGRVPVKAWTRGVPVEEQAREQLRNVASLPFVFKHVAVMPDVHWGMGATVGSVIATKGAIVPAAVGVDIGCGMVATRLPLSASQLPDNLAGVRSTIEAAVPHGRTDYGGFNDRGAWGNPPPDVRQVMGENGPLRARLLSIVEKHEKLHRASNRAPNHLGTLGTGNHFIEVCLDEANNVWVMLHSGSRGIGNRIATHFIEKAQELVKMWFVHLPDVDLAYLPQGIKEFDEYVEAVAWAQRFAMVNREIMMENALNALRKFFPDLVTTEEAVNCHHNYVEMENHYGANVWLTR